MTTLTFLGTGNYLAEGRLWNSFVVDGRILVEPSPTALPQLRRAGLTAAQIDAVFVSHFHADHTFGWPFLLLEMLRHRGDRPLYVVGPPNIEAYLGEMMAVGGVEDVRDAAAAALDLRYVEVDCTLQDAADVRFRAIEVEHVPTLRCFGFLIELDGQTLGYSGDTRPCAGLDELASSSDTLVLECNGRHPWPTHMDVESVRALQARFPDVRLVLSHLGGDVHGSDFERLVVPDDLDSITI